MLKRIAFTSLFAVLAFGLALAADFSKIPNALENAQVGQWVAYTSMGGTEQKQSIVKIEGEGEERVITIKTEITMGGQTVQETENAIAMKDVKEQQKAAWEADPDVKITDTTVSAGGKDYKAVLIETTNEGVVTKLYMSADVPVTGIVQMESSMLPGPIMVIKDFGN